MHVCTWLAAALATVGALSMALASEGRSTQADSLRALDGEWIFVEDRTAGRTLEQLGPPMASKFSLRVEDAGGAVVLNGHGSGHRDVRIALDGGLVYVAQPGGAKPTEFVLTEVSPTRAVFDNPRHDYPKRTVYERATDGGLSAIIGFAKGGTPRRFEFKREGK